MRKHANLVSVEYEFGVEKPADWKNAVMLRGDMVRCLAGDGLGFVLVVLNRSFGMQYTENCIEACVTFHKCNNAHIWKGCSPCCCSCCDCQNPCYQMY